MTKTFTILALGAMLASVAAPAMATTGTDFSAPAFRAARPAVLLLARHGADDPASHHLNDDKGGDRPGKGGKRRGGRDDGPFHA